MSAEAGPRGAWPRPRVGGGRTPGGGPVSASARTPHTGQVCCPPSLVLGEENHRSHPRQKSHFSIDTRLRLLYAATGGQSDVGVTPSPRPGFEAVAARQRVVERGPMVPTDATTVKASGRSMREDQSMQPGHDGTSPPRLSRRASTQATRAMVVPRLPDEGMVVVSVLAATAATSVSPPGTPSWRPGTPR